MGQAGVSLPCYPAKSDEILLSSYYHNDMFRARDNRMWKPYRLSFCDTSCQRGHGRHRLAGPNVTQLVFSFSFLNGRLYRELSSGRTHVQTFVAHFC